jgi:hypothetical protein
MSATGGYSVVDDLVNGDPVELTGEGELAGQQAQEIPPAGPGRGFSTLPSLPFSVMPLLDRLSSPHST